MATPATPRELDRLHPEERYQPELASTEVSRGTARFLAWSFVAIIFSVPLLQLGHDVFRPRDPSAPPVAPASAGGWRGVRAALGAIRQRGFFKDFENGVERASIAWRPALTTALKFWPFSGA